LGGLIVVAVSILVFVFWDSTVRLADRSTPEEQLFTQEVAPQSATPLKQTQQSPPAVLKTAVVKKAHVVLKEPDDSHLTVPQVSDEKKPATPFTEPEDSHVANKSPQQVVAEVDPSVVSIHVTTQDGRVGGSGFVIDEIGTIATNYHVIEGAQAIEIVFRDQEIAPAMGWTGISPGKDLALLRTFFPKQRPQALPLATGVLQRAETVITVGSPFGLKGSVSIGIVSAIRTLEDTSSVYDADTCFVQTTAPISPGNSGGPLVNLKGEVVGVNTMGFTRGQNLNFAVAVRHLIDLIESSDGKFHAWSDLPPPRLDPKVLAAQSQAAKERKQAQEQYEKIAQNIDNIARNIKAAQEDATRERSNQEELNRINARMITLKKELRAVEIEGTQLTQSRGRVFAQAEAVNAQARQVSRQIVDTQNELADRRWRLGLATYNKLYDLVELRKRQIRDLEASLRYLTSEYRTLQSTFLGLDRESRALLGQIQYKESERYQLLQGIANLNREYKLLQGVPAQE